MISWKICFPVFLTHLKNKGQTEERKPKCSESPLAIFFIYIWTICWHKCPKTKTGGNRGMFFEQQLKNKTDLSIFQISHAEKCTYTLQRLNGEAAKKPN